jgi:BlaI family penicillinase repressor
LDGADALQNAILRYGRVQLCATALGKASRKNKSMKSSGQHTGTERLSNERFLSTKFLVDAFSPRVYFRNTNSLVNEIETNERGMARKKSRTLTDAEHRIMEVLWNKGSATVAEVAETLSGKDGSAYTTILTMMGILREKGYLTCRKETRAHIYTPKVNRETAARKAVGQLLSKFFAGSPSELVLSFLRDEDISPEELDELKKRILESDDRGK